MKFMDLLFSRYASPFLLLDEVILTGDLFEFVMFLMNKTNEEQEWEFFLHKVFDKSFKEFREGLTVDRKTHEMSKSDIETTIQDSMNMTMNFIPDEQGVK